MLIVGILLIRIYQETLFVLLTPPFLQIIVSQGAKK